MKEKEGERERKTERDIVSFDLSFGSFDLSFGSFDLSFGSISSGISSGILVVVLFESSSLRGDEGEDSSKKIFSFCAYFDRIFLACFPSLSSPSIEKSLLHFWKTNNAK
jgi:hypothetical protein